jgi:hypothetical protein
MNRGEFFLLPARCVTIVKEVQLHVNKSKPVVGGSRSAPSRAPPPPVGPRTPMVEDPLC